MNQLGHALVRKVTDRYRKFVSFTKFTALGITADLKHHQ